MSNDFINWREYDRRRRSGSGTSTPVSKELILLPTFDTYFFHQPLNIPGGDRWNAINPRPSPDVSTQLIVGLLNPWNDGINIPGGGPFDALVAPRTPTRSVLSYDLTQLPTGVNVQSANLNLTVAGNSFWNASANFQPAFRSDEASNIMDDVWVAYNFDGTPPPPQYMGRVRAMGYGGSESGFSWFNFIQGYSFFNPSGLDGTNPWSIKKWYQWGQRNFELHQPFGRPYFVPAEDPFYGVPANIPRNENGSYQADGYLCARDGFVVNGFQVNRPMPWVTNDFEKIWKALITGDITQLTPYQRTQLSWFDPNDPIKVIVYNGCISRLSETEENQYPRWNALFAADYDSSLQRLKDSVQPFINCGMQIALDALVIAPGPRPGDYIPMDLMNFESQRGWWEFYTWLKNTVGTRNLYCEAHPIRRKNLRTGYIDSNPYLGMNVVAGEDFSYTPSLTYGDWSFHKMSELGSVKYLRSAIWSPFGPKTFRTAIANSGRSQARYPDLLEWGTLASDADYRISLSQATNNYQSGLMHIFAARNIKDRYDQEGDLYPEQNITQSGYIFPPTILQSYTNTPAGQQQFIQRFPTAVDFKAYLDSYVSPPQVLPPTPVNNTSADNTTGNEVAIRSLSGGSGADCRNWGGYRGPTSIAWTTEELLDLIRLKLKLWTEKGKIDRGWLLTNLDIIKILTEDPLRELGQDNKHWIPLVDIFGRGRSLRHIIERNSGNSEQVEHEGQSCYFELYWKSRFVTTRANYLASRPMMERIKKSLQGIKNKEGEILWDKDLEGVFKKYDDQLFFDEFIAQGLTCRQITDLLPDYICRLRATLDAFFDAMDDAVADKWFWVAPIEWDTLSQAEINNLECKGALDYKTFKEQYLKKQLNKRHMIPSGQFGGPECLPLNLDNPLDVFQALPAWGEGETLDQRLKEMFERYSSCGPCQVTFIPTVTIPTIPIIPTIPNPASNTPQ